MIVDSDPPQVVGSYWYCVGSGVTPGGPRDTDLAQYPPAALIPPVTIVATIASNRLNDAI